MIYTKYMDKLELYNEEILNLCSYYLNNCERLIDSRQINEVTACGVSEEKAFQLLFISYFNIENKEFIDLYINKLITKSDPAEYLDNKYLKDIKYSNQKLGDWEMKYAKYEPYELFVKDDFIYNNGRVIPNLSFFNKEFQYPAIYQKDRLWMSVTPNEINTMIDPINMAHGKVLTFGLGMGYYAYMVSEKESVQSVTIVEKDKNVIELFKTHILPQFREKSKICIIEDDAYNYLAQMEDNKFDYVFVDIYHDASDGMEVYEKFKPYEKNLPNTTFDYWIEKTIKYYID